MPPGIENEDYDSEGDIYFFEELLSNDTLPLLENESSKFDHHDDPSFLRPPSEPPNVEIFFDTGVLAAKVVEYISEHHMFMPKVLPSQPTLCLILDPLLPFSSENEDKVFKPGILSYLLNSSNAIAPVLPTEEPDNSLNMGDEHLSTILEKESDEVIKCCVENLVPIPSEFKVTSDNDNTLIDSSPKFDYLLELAHIDPIPSGYKKADFDLEEEIRLVENLLFDNSSPRPSEELNVEIADMILESLSPSPIPVEDSDSQMEEIDLILDMDDLMPSDIKNDDYDSEGDIHFLEELLRNDTLPLLKNESSNFDHHDDYLSCSLFCPIIPRASIFCIWESNILDLNDISDDSINDPLLEEVNLFLASDNSKPPGIENFGYDSEVDIRFLEELLIDDSIPFPNNESSDFEDDPLFPRPPSEPSNVEFDFELNSGEEILDVMNNNNEDNCFDPGREVDIFTDDDYFPFIFVIQIFIPYLIYPEVSPLLLSAGSEDTIFDPGISV
nr:hypothetical protein [Tanacetum cinerariifolium]